jgi:hypothetical protein
MVSVSMTAEFASAQFTGPITPPQLPLPTQPAVTSNPAGNSGRTIQQIMMLRYLQQRSGGGVKRGVPQFIPFGNQGGFVPQAMQQQDAAPQVDTGKKSNEDKKAEYQAAREAKKKAAQERAEKRKAARAKGATTSASKNPA